MFRTQSYMYIRYGVRHTVCTCKFKEQINVLIHCGGTRVLYEEDSAQGTQKWNGRTFIVQEECTKITTYKQINKCNHILWRHQVGGREYNCHDTQCLGDCIYHTALHWYHYYTGGRKEEALTTCHSAHQQGRYVARHSTEQRKVRGKCSTSNTRTHTHINVHLHMQHCRYRQLVVHVAIYTVHRSKPKGQCFTGALLHVQVGLLEH